VLADEATLLPCEATMATDKRYRPKAIDMQMNSTTFAPKIRKCNRTA